MTPKEAVRAMDERAPIKVAIPLYGTIEYKRIANVRINSDKYGKRFYTAELAGELNGIENTTLVCGTQEMELADSAPDYMRERVYPKNTPPKPTTVTAEPPAEAMKLIDSVLKVLEKFKNGTEITTEELLTAAEELSRAREVLSEAISVPAAVKRVGNRQEVEV